MYACIAQPPYVKSQNCALNRQENINNVCRRSLFYFATEC